MKLKHKFYKFMGKITFGNIKNFYVKKLEKYNKVEKSQPYFDVMSYDCNRKIGESIRNDYDFNEQLNGLMLSSSLNKIKELDLKRKIKEGKKVRVCFLIDDVSRFSANTVYKEMLKNEVFEPFVVLINQIDGNFIKNENSWDLHLKSIDILTKQGYKVFNGYDDNKNLIPFETFKPDIIFMTAPYLDYHDTTLTNIYLNTNYLVCYLPYHFGTVNNYSYHYNNRRIASCWKNFVSSREDYIENLKYSEFCGINAVLCGYPKLDAYSKPLENCKIPSKIDNGKPIVIYAPHHSIRDNWEPVNLATFHIYYKYFLNLVKSNPNINFVFKPHPTLVVKVVEQNIMTKDEYQAYIKEWDSQPNGLYVFDGEYIDLFRRSDLLIQDSGSFIGEWLPTDKPCMYLVNPERNQDTYMNGFSIIGRKILEKYYLCHNKQEIEHYFNMLMFDKNDPLIDERIKIKDGIYINIGCAGQKITEYLETILKD